MKPILLVLVPVLYAQPAAHPSDWVAAGIHYNNYSAPQLGGLVVYAHRVSDSGTYSFSMIQFTSVSTNPFRLGTIPETGVAQYIKNILGFEVYGVAMAGAVTSSNSGGTNVGFAGSAGGLAHRGIGKGFGVAPYLLYTKPGGIPQQWAVGVLISLGR